MATVKGTAKVDSFTVNSSSVIVVTGKKSSTKKISKNGKNRIYGAAAKDTFTVKGGKLNYIYGDAGNDTITITSKIGTGNKIYGDDAKGKVSSNDTFNINGGSKNYFYGGKGTDTFNINGGNSNYLYGGAGKDTYFFGKKKATATIKDYAAGQDTLKVNSGAITSTTVKGKDVTFKAGNAIVTLTGAVAKAISLKDSRGSYTASNTTIKLDKDFKGTMDATKFLSTVKTIDGRSASKSIVITGNTNDNIIYAGKAGGTYRGGIGNDTYYGDAGNDTFVYNTGNDTIYNYVSGSDAIKLASTALQNSVASGNDAVLNLTNGGKITVKNAVNKDIVLIDSTGARQTVKVPIGGTNTGGSTGGNTGGTSTSTTVINISGTDDEPVLKGTSGDDIIYGGYGTKSVYGNSGNDKIYVGLNSDKYKYVGNQIVFGGKGNDSIYAYSGEDVLYGGEGNDSIYVSSSLGCYAYGGEGDDYISLTSKAANKAFGGKGNDSFYVNAYSGGSQELFGGEGNDEYTIRIGYFDYNLNKQTLGMTYIHNTDVGYTTDEYAKLKESTANGYDIPTVVNNDREDALIFRSDRSLYGDYNRVEIEKLRFNLNKEFNLVISNATTGSIIAEVANWYTHPLESIKFEYYEYEDNTWKKYYKSYTADKINKIMSSTYYGGTFDDYSCTDYEARTNYNAITNINDHLIFNHDRFKYDDHAWYRNIKYEINNIGDGDVLDLSLLFNSVDYSVYGQNLIISNSYNIKTCTGVGYDGDRISRIELTDFFSGSSKDVSIILPGKNYAVKLSDELKNAGITQMQSAMLTFSDSSVSSSANINNDLFQQNNSSDIIVTGNV